MFKKNTAVTGFTVGLIATADGSDITTGTPTGYYTLDGGAQGTIADNTPVHEGNGQWSFDLLAAEMNGDIVSLAFKHTSAVTQHFTIKTDTKIVSELQDIAAGALMGLANGAITAVKFGAGAIDAAALSTDAVDEIVDATWDEVVSGAAHNTTNTAGRRLRELRESGFYTNGFIFIDTVNGADDETDYEAGTEVNPTNSIAHANAIALSLGLSRFNVAPGSTITLAATQQNQVFAGNAWTLALGGQDIAGTSFHGADAVTGVGTGADPHFHDCALGDMTLAAVHAERCGLGGTFTMSAAATYLFNSCYSSVAGSATPVIDFGAAVANSALNMRHYSGGINITNKNAAASTDTMSLEGDGQLVVAASSGGAISLRGDFEVTNTGGATITYDDSTADWLDGGRLDLILDIIAEDTTTDIPALIAALENISEANVLTQVNAALDDTVPELGIGTPSASPTLRTAISFLYMALRNKRLTDANQDDIHNDAGAVICSAVLSDDTLEFIKAEYI